MQTSRRQPLVFASDSTPAAQDSDLAPELTPDVEPANAPTAAIVFKPVERPNPDEIAPLAEPDAPDDADADPPFLPLRPAAPRPTAGLGGEARADRTPVLLAAIASLTWVAGLIALGLAFPQTLAPLAKGPIATAALLVLLASPLALVWAAALVLGDARRLLAESHRARAFTEQMMAPAAAAAVEAGGLIESLHGQIAEASIAAKKAGERLAGLRDAVAEETELLAQATSYTDQTAGKLVASLSAQRVELNTLAVTLEARAAAVTDVMNRQAHMVADASDLAETQLGEAQAALTARSADLAATAAQAAEISRIAAEDLARQAARLESAGTGVGDQLRSLEEGLTGQRAGLVTLAHGLRADQEEFASLAETRTAQLSTLIASAAHEAQSLNEAAAHGARAVGLIVEQAGERFASLASAAGEHRGQFETASASALAALEVAGERQRVALSDSLAGAAASMEDRLAQARSVIEESARLADEAAGATAARLTESFEGVGHSLAELRALADEVLAAADRLPSEAAERGEAIRASLAGSLESLVASARRTAEETQAIDAAFQDRVRRNYEMLSEAVKLMGVVAHAGQAPEPLLRRPREPAPEPDPIALRPRLRLTALEDETESVPDPEPKSDWTWQGLPAEAEEPVQGDGGEISPFNAIAAMGIDPAALLTRGRIQEIAQAIQTGDNPGARDVVRTLAPAATRRLARRVLSDRAFGAMSRAFVASYAEQLGAAVRSDPEGYQAASLLACDLGRAYLLLDASTVSAR